MGERDWEAEFWRIIAASWLPPERFALKAIMQRYYTGMLGRRF